jgi:sarcosine oxidase, subunit alpha
VSGFRLPGHAPARTLAFRFNGKAYAGREGDTLTSALLANGVTLVGRSFKYHRPRGIVGSGFDETNALVQLESGARTVPNVPATRVPLYNGLEARSVNCWPSVGFDLGAVNDRLSRLLSAGFYYKSFMWPGWHVFEGAIRRAAGLGRAPALPDPDRYAAQRHDCAVLVVGGGVAGLAAARAAAEAGGEVVLVEADTELGGRAGADDAWVAEAARALAAAPNVRILRRTTALGYYDHDLVTAIEEVDAPGLRQRFWKIRADRVILAGGAFERPLLFGGNDVPGVMLVDAVRHYLERHGVAAGRRPLFAVNHDDAYRAAFAAKRAGLDVVGIVDLRDTVGAVADEARALGIAVSCDCDIVRTHGRKALKAVTILDRATGARRRLRCDLLGMSGGWSPAVQLFSQSGGTLRFDAGIGAFIPERSVQSERSCGAARGIFARDDCIADGEAAGRGLYGPVLPRGAGGALSLPAPGAKAFVDFQTDVTVDDLRLATRENYRSVEHVKRYTVWGMGTDQGKLSGVNGIAALAALQGIEAGALGTTKFRPPFAPVAFGALAAEQANGKLLKGWRRLPAHDWHEEQGAAFEDYDWLRPTHYPQGSETMAAAAEREAIAVRARVGLIDSSSFGKIELKGPEAGRFLDLLSVGSPSTIPVGSIRYNLLTDEYGTLIDDGVVSRLGDDHFLLNASSGHAGRIARWLDQWHQCEWPLDLVIQDVTEAWAVLALAGPRARAVLEHTGCDVDLSREAFPHNRIRTGHIGGVPVRIQRVSFTGELCFEIGIAADYGASLARHLMACGAAEGLIAFGLEALDILRLEKGYLHVGTDTDSRTQPADIGWGKGVARKASDFVGKRSLLHPAARRPGRAELVGLRPVDPAVVLPVGAHVIGGDPHPSQGIVTSSAFSPALGRGLSLGLLGGGHSRHGEQVRIWSEGKSWPAVVAAPGGYDPEGARLRD